MTGEPTAASGPATPEGTTPDAAAAPRAEPPVEAFAVDVRAAEVPGTVPDAAPPRMEPPSPDVEVVTTDARLPGEHRGGFARLPTGPVDVTEPIGPQLDLPPDADVRWYLPEPAPPRSGMAAWALGFSIVGLIGSLFVGWGFPIGVAGIVSAIVALRRPLEPRAVAVWAIVLGALSIVYSAGWLLWAASRTNLLG